MQECLFEFVKCRKNRRIFHYFCRKKQELSLLLSYIIIAEYSLKSKPCFCLSF